MSSTGDAWATVAEAREDWRRADDELPKLRAVHGDLEAILDALVRNKPEQVAVDPALDSVERLGGDSDARREALDFLSEPVLDGDRSMRAAFQSGRAVTTEADGVASALADYTDGGDWNAVTTAVTAVLQPPDGPMAIDTTTLDQLVTLFGLAIEAGIAAREARADRLQSALSDAYAASEEPLPDLDEQPITLLPVRLETRFVDDAGTKADDLSQLLVRVYPDQIHTDSHEEQLTDDEVAWGQNFWATLWYARHPDPSVIPNDPAASYLQDRLPNQRLRELVAEIDPAQFSDAHHKRYRELKERAWRQLLDRFGRERAAYVVHALEPTDADLADDLQTRPPAPTDSSETDGETDTDVGGGPTDRTSLAGKLDTDAVIDQVDKEVAFGRNDRNDRNDRKTSPSIDREAAIKQRDRRKSMSIDSGRVVDSEQSTVDTYSVDDIDVDSTPSLPKKLPALAFPDVPRRPESWTQQPRATLLPDRWIAVAEWETPKGKTKRTAIEGDPIREPLPVGPSPESVADEDLAGQGTDSPAPDRTEWMVDFEDAEAVGMGLRLGLSSLSGFDPHRGFSKLTVVGVKASVEADQAPDELVDLLDAHHYTDGLEFLEQGTPTNNHDEPSGYSRTDDPLDSMAIEAGEPLLESGDRSDGDLLARALAIDSDDEHVFAHVENAGGTEQRDARHMNSALWPATLGYFFQDLLIDNDLTDNPSIFGGGMPEHLTGSKRRQRLNELMLWHDAYRRHFVRYVRGRGPFPALRVGKQPYGILPTKAIDTKRDIPVVDQGLVTDLELGRTSVGDLQERGTDLGTLVDGGVDTNVLLNAGAKPDELLQAGARPDDLLAGGIDPKTVVEGSGLVPASMTQDGIGLLKTSHLTRSRLESAGVPVEDLQQDGVTVRALTRGEVTDDQLESAGVTTKSVAEAVLPRQARALGITPTALERAGVTPGALLRGEISSEQVEKLGLTSRAVADAVLPQSVRDLGITPKTIEDAGISPVDLLNGTVSAEDLETAGVTPEALADALLPQELRDFGITPEQIGQAVSLEDLFNGDVGVEDLQQAGLSTQHVADALLPQSFRDAGITPDSLESAGITPAAILNGQVTPQDVIDAGVTPDALAEAGVLPDALADVGSVFGDLLDAGLKPMELLERGLSPKSLVDAGVDPHLLVEAGLAPKELVDAGVDVVEFATKGTVPVEDLLQAGASPQELSRLGATVEDLSGGEIPAQELVQTGFTAIDLLQQGADALGVAQGGARPSHLREAGVDAGTLHDADKAAGSLRRAGYTAQELLDSEYTVEELLNGGFSREELSAAGVDQADLEATGRAVEDLLAAGHPPDQFRENGYGADQLLDAGLDATGLVAAGYTAGELKDAGLSTDQLVAAGVDPGELRAAGVDSKALADAGVDARTLKDAGAKAEDLLDHGFDPQALLDAGFASVELEVAGVDVDDLVQDVVEGEADTDEIEHAAVEGLQYAATVLEDPEQAERDLYSFSFDPAVPRLTGQTNATAGGDADDAAGGQTDGGVAAGVPVVRTLSVDDKLPAHLKPRLTGLDDHFDAALSAPPFAGDTESADLLDILERTGLSTNVRQQTLAFSAEPSDHPDAVNNFVRYWYGGGSPIRSLVTDMCSGRIDLDPRIGHFRLEDISRKDIDTYRKQHGSSGRTGLYNYILTFDRQGEIEPHEMVDANVGQFIDVLYHSTFSDVRLLSQTISVKPENVNLNAGAIDGLDGWSGRSETEIRQQIIDALESADDPNEFVDELTKNVATSYTGRAKLLQLAQNQVEYGESGVLRSLLRLLLQYGTLQEYVAARRRLGLAYDDVPDGWPDPAYYGSGTVGPLDTLHDSAPKILGLHPNIGSMASVGGDNYDYVDALRDAALNYTSSTSIDPRMSEFTDSLQYLGGLEPTKLSTLAHETLDLASHRLDAWWTSLATKDLFELREAQGSYDTDAGVDHDKWNGVSDVPRATLEPGLLSSIDLGDTAGRAAQATQSQADATDTSGLAGGVSDTADLGFTPGLGSSASSDASSGSIDSSKGPSESIGSSQESADSSQPASKSTASTPRFDPAAIANLDVALPSGDDGDSQTDGGIGPLDPNIGGSSSGETEGQGSNGGSASGTGSAGDGTSGQSGSIDLSALQEAGHLATRGQLTDPSVLTGRTQSDPGIYVGGYGFVEDLSADVEGQDGPEYVHAPSAQHATTAAVLRSGAKAHDDDEGENVLAIDLSADRVRAGLRLIRGVRRGQSLAELLGYRFERRLREETLGGESNLMQYADVFRTVFPAKLDKLQRPDESQVEGKAERKEQLARRDVVDGRKLVENWDDYPFDRGADLPDTDTDAYEAIDHIVSELADDVDAAGDLLTAESVHQLGQGNYDRAGGSVGALADGEPLPDPAIARTPRSEIALTHRQCLLFGTPAVDGQATPRSAAEPALASWVEGFLPDHDTVECLGTYRWEEPTDDDSDTTVERTHETTVTLADLNLGSLDVLLLFGTDSESARSELEQRLVYALVRDRPDDPAVPADADIDLELTATDTDGAVTMANLLELARSVRELVQSARPVTAEDLAHPADQRGEGYDVGTADTLAARANTAQDRLLSVATAIDGRLAVLDSEHAAGDGVDDLAATQVASADGGSTGGDSDASAGQGGGLAGGSWGGLGGGVALPPEISPVADIPFRMPEPTLTEQATDLVDAVEATDGTAPFSTTESVATAIDPDAIRDELSTLLDTLPAGVTDPNAVDADVTVEADTEQPIVGVLGDSIAVPATDTAGSDQSSSNDGDSQSSSTDEGSQSSSTDGDNQSTSGSGESASDDTGAPSSSGPTTWMPPGGPLDVSIPGSASSTTGSQASDATTATGEDGAVDMSTLSEVEYSGTPWYAENLDSVTMTSGLDLQGASESTDDDGTAGDDASETDSSTADSTQSEQSVDWSSATATVRAWGTDGLSWFETKTRVTPETDGSFSVDLDFSGVDPGTPFQVVAVVEDTVVYSASGRVVADDSATTAQSTLDEDCPTLRQLLWLRDRQPRLDTDSDPLSGLSAALSAAEFDAMQAERDAADPEHSPITTADVDAVDDLLGLADLDLSALASSVDTSAGPVSKLGLDRIVDITGDGAPGDVEFWYGPTAALGDVRARLSRTLDNPALYNAGAAPWLLSYHHDSAAVLHGMDGGENVAAYLDAFLSAPPWLVRYLDGHVEDPATLLRELTAWLYAPSEAADPGDLATWLHDLASVVTDLPALATLFEGLPTTDGRSTLETFKIYLQGLASTIGGGAPSLPDASTAKSTFDAAISSATTDLASHAHSVSMTITPVAGSAADRSFRRIVLERLREPMTVAASYGVYGGTPRSPDGGRPDDEAALLEQARALLERLRTRLSEAATLDPRLTSAQDARPVPQRVEDQTDRLETLFGDGFTVLPPFTPSNGAELVSTFTDDQLLGDQSMAGETLLQRAASFRGNVDAFREARTYAEAIAGTLTPSLTIGQVPYEPGDTWVGVEGVEPAPGKLSLVAQFGPDATPGAADGPLTGLFVDEWTEAVPEDTETTGVALNYDDPGMRAPQSVLVATPPEDGEWTLDDLAATIDETLAYTKRRAVDLGDMDEVGQLFPGLYFAQQNDSTPSTPTVAFEMLDWYDRQLEYELVPPRLQYDIGRWSTDG